SGAAGLRIAAVGGAAARWALALGFAAVAWPVATQLWPDRLYFLYPAFPLGEILFGATFFLAGVLVRSHMALSRTRIVVGVFVAVLAYFVFAEPAHLA